MTKINVLNIIRDHLNTLVNDNNKKPSTGDWLSFLILPVFFTIIMTIYFPVVSDGFADTLITILAIFVGLLINVTVLLFDLVKTNDKRGIKRIVVSQTLTNISYIIVISIFTIICSLITKVDYFKVKELFTVFTYFLMFHILATLLMIIKRMYVLFKSEIDNIQE
jgi:hypothetical protein